MTHSVTVVSPPGADPVTVAEAKLFAKIDTAADDTLIASLISTAAVHAEDYTRRAFITRTLRVALSVPPSSWADRLPAGTYELPVSILSSELPSTVHLPHKPIQSVSSINTYDHANAASLFSASNYLVDAGGGRLTLNPGASWPTGLRSVNAIEITYVAGYGDASAVPSPIKTAILMHFQRMYDERIVCDLPASCEQLLRKYKIYGPL